MEPIKESFLTLLIIVFGILYFYDKPFAERLISVLVPIFMFLIGMVIVYFGVTIIRDNKRLAEDRMERLGTSSVQRVLSLQYRENPLRLTIALAGISIIGVGFLCLSFAFPNAAFDGFRGTVFISVIIVIGSGVMAVIAALFMLKRK